jgi:hypothetical protein
VRSALLIAILAALVGGCSAWTGPRVVVEDRSIAPDRPKAMRVRSAPPARVASKAPAQSFCDGYASSLIHPLHFDAGADKCPLLQWDIRMATDSR